MKNIAIKSSLIAGFILILAMEFIRSRSDSTSTPELSAKLAIVNETSPAADEPTSSPTSIEEVITNSMAIAPTATFSNVDSTASKGAFNLAQPPSHDLVILSNGSDAAASETNAAIELPPIWTNSLGMILVLVPETGMLFSIYDVRVQDYQAFVTATRREWRRPSFEQGPTHPAGNVSWYDAKAFCAWLTEKEQAQQYIAAPLGYRLPTGEEWDVAAWPPGSETGLLPWSDRWPPPWGFGNFSQKLKADAYENTSSVGAFLPNKYGLYDMWGNVEQWCERSVGPGRHYDGPIRGAGYLTSEPKFLQRSFITHSFPTNAWPALGFRVVLTARPQ